MSSPSFIACGACKTRNSVFNPRCIGCDAALTEQPSEGLAPVTDGERKRSPTAARMLGPYRLEQQVGAGATGSVVRARHTTTGAQVVLKLLRPELATSSEARRRFAREARALAAIDHPNIGRILDVLELEPSPVLVLEPCAGDSLEALLRAGALAESAVGAILGQLAHALDALHGQGIVHRDVKPSNVIVSDQLHLKLVDFGLARMLEHRPGSFRTEAGIVLGSLAYAAPEVITGEPATPASDRWSLGVLAYEMLTGQRPFVGPSRVALATAIVSCDPDAFELAGPFAHVVRTLLAVDPSLRGRSACEALAGGP